MRKQYTVQPGQTLWGIAQDTLGKGQRYQEIAGMNKAHVGDPAQIQPGWVLDMPADANGPGVRAVAAPSGSGGSGGTGGGGNGTGGDGMAGGGAGGGAGGEHVMVDRQRAQAAASALEELRDTLAQQMPAILTAISNLRGEGASLPPPAAIQQLQGRSPQDAAEMRAAARLAAALNNQLAGNAPAKNGGRMLDTGASWDPQSLDDAAAKVDAQALVAATTTKNAKAARAAVLGVTQDLADHQGDTGYLSAFWSQNGVPAAAANLAGILNHQDGNGATLLSPEDQSILGTFGTGLAAVTSASGTPGAMDPAASRRLTDAFTNPASPWSAAMLLKYGPDGSAYGTAQGANLLATVTRSVFNARENGQYTLPLDTGQLRDGPYDKNLIPTMQAYDPLTAMLQRSAENKIAATQVLGGPGGGRYAHDLLSTPFTRYLDTYSDGTTGQSLQAVNPDPGSEPQGALVHEFLLNQQTIGSFLGAATEGTDPAGAPPSGTSETGRLSAQAALNIIENTPNPGSINVSEPVRHALMDTYGRYMPEIAASVEGQYAGSTGQVLQANGNGPWTFELPVGNSSLPNFMQQIFTNHDDAALIQAETLRSFGQAFGWQMRNGPSPAPASDLAGSLSALYAETDAQEKNLGYSQAQMEDSRNKALDNLIQMAPLVLIPLPGSSVAGKVAAGLLRVRFAATPWMAQAASTDNAAQLAAIDKNDAAVKQDMVGVAMTQGLINQGIITPPAGADWFQGKPPQGKVIPTAAYSDWWNENMGYPVAQLPAQPQQQSGKPLPGNSFNSKLLEDWWMEYGYRMGLADSLTGKWDTGSSSGSGSAPAG